MGHKTKETYPTRPGSPTPCKQGLKGLTKPGGSGGGGGGGLMGGLWVTWVIGLIFAGYVPLAFQNPYPFLVTLGKKGTCNPSLVTFCLCIYLIMPFNLVILK